MAEGWRKLAIAGSTYARALENAAARTGRQVAPEAFASIKASPLAKLDPHASAFARGRAAPGELPMTSERQGLLGLVHRMPWATDEHTGLRGGSEYAVNRFNQLLEETGRAHMTPAGQPSTQQQITRNFGRPRDPGRVPTQIGRAPNATQTTPGMGPRRLLEPDPRMLMDAGGGTRVGQEPVIQPRKVPTPSSLAGTQVLRKSANASALAGIGVPLAVGAGMLLNKPGIRADLTDRLVGQGDIRQKDMAQEIPESVTAQARAVAQALASRGLDPHAMRIAVDAPAGAGKTVLSRAMANEMGIKHQGLDWRPNLGLHRLLGGGDIEKMPYQPHPGEILEHQQLLRSYDPESFDAAVHLVRTPEEIKANLLKRGRGARTYDMLDYDKSIDVGRRAFDTLGGDAIDLGGGAFMKIRPQEGWGNALDTQLAQMGIDATGLSRHEKLLSLHSGKRETGAGWTPYAKSPFDPDEMRLLGASLPLGSLAARALASQ